MSTPDLLLDGPARAPLTVVLAHGAGAPMDSAFMAWFARGIVGAGLRVVRFEFPYMAARRKGGSNRPPDRMAVLCQCWRDVVGTLGAGSLVIGGKSMGGRVASTLADVLEVRGLLCLGYPFHPPGQPERTRIEHLRRLETPTLVCQGSRDPFGNRAEVERYPPSPAISLCWMEDGYYSFKPRKASGRSEEDNRTQALVATVGFTARLRA